MFVQFLLAIYSYTHCAKYVYVVFHCYLHKHFCSLFCHLTQSDKKQEYSQTSTTKNKNIPRQAVVQGRHRQSRQQCEVVCGGLRRCMAS